MAHLGRGTGLRPWAARPLPEERTLRTNGCRVAAAEAEAPSLAAVR